MSRLDEYEALRAEGLTYKEIAARFGVSLQAVAMALARRGGKFRAYNRDRVVFDGLRKWLNENQISTSELIRRYYGRNHNGSAITKMHAMLQGKRLDKKGIDFFRNLTGLTYEELFCSQEDEDG